ncbi:MAG: hypothetical protein HY075_08860 [Deltaproteobacteria bacterium]|nr:hypothetical protein [Deltaproteobacteria bacterium]
MTNLKRLAGCFILSALVAAAPAAGTERLDTRDVVLDGQGKLLPWGNHDSLYDHVMKLSWGLLKRVPVQPNGLRTYLTYPRFNGDAGKDFLTGIWWAHNPAGLISMLTDSALEYYAYSGDADVLRLAREGLDQQLRNGTTPRDFAWASVPYASSEPGAVKYEGAEDAKFCAV